MRLICCKKCRHNHDPPVYHDPHDHYDPHDPHDPHDHKNLQYHKQKSKDWGHHVRLIHCINTQSLEDALVEYTLQNTV